MPTNWTGTLLSGYGLYDQLDRYADIGDRAIEGTNQLADQATAGSTFKPYTVTSSVGSATGGPEGLAMNLSPEQQAMMNQLSTGSSGLFGQAVLPTEAREQSVYDRIRATQLPEEQRAQQIMNDRLFAQGRSGIRSDAYGGTPEQLAYHKAVQESQNNASLMALQQAKAEQLQNTQMCGMFQNASYMPQANLLNTINPALQTANMNQAGQFAGTGLASQLGMGGLEMSLNADVARGELLSRLFGSFGDAIGGTDFDPIGTAAGGLWGILNPSKEPA